MERRSQNKLDELIILVEHFKAERNERIDIFNKGSNSK